MKRRTSRGRQYAIAKPDTRPRHPATCPWRAGTGFSYVTKSGNQLEWSAAVDHVHLLDVVRCSGGELTQERIEYRDFTEPKESE